MLKLIILSIFFIKINVWDLGKPYPKSRKGQKDWLCDLMKFLISHANHSTPCFIHQISMHGPPDSHASKIPFLFLYSKATTVKGLDFTYSLTFLISSQNSSPSKNKNLLKTKFSISPWSCKVNSFIHLIFYNISRWIHIILFIICDDHP